MTDDLSSVTARLDAMEKAVDIVRAATMAMPTPGIVQERVDGLAALVKEQRASSKEAIDKSDKSVQAVIAEQGKRLDDLKGRMDLLEGAIGGMRTLIVMVGLVLGALIGGITLLTPDPVTVAPRANTVNIEP